MKTLIGMAFLMMVVSTIMLTDCYGIKNPTHQLVVAFTLGLGSILLGRYVGRRLE